ncbi:MAG: LamG domain-containing protein [Opitutus sp.]|nr:LamG domain-containing protein [Opitutus sp.]
MSGHFGNGLYFPGVTGSGSTRVEIPNSASLQITSAVTFAAWVRVDDIGRDAPILAKEGPGGILSYWFGTFGLNTEGASPGNFGMLLDVDGNQGWEAYDRNQGSITAGTPVHLTSTWNGSQISHYLNGTFAGGGAAFASTVHASTAQLVIGANSEYNTTAFSGIIDELYLYNRALSVGEIQQLMAAPIPEPASCVAGLAGAALILAPRRRRCGQA